MKKRLIPYMQLMNQLLIGELTPSDFQLKYMELFKSNEIPFRDEEYKILNKVFSAAESYCHDILLRDELDLGEQQLLEEVKKGLVSLRALSSQSVNVASANSTSSNKSGK